MQRTVFTELYQLSDLRHQSFKHISYHTLFWRVLDKQTGYSVRAYKDTFTTHFTIQAIWLQE